MAPTSTTTIPLRAHTAMERWVLTELQKRGAQPISAEQTFEELGLKSLDFIEIVIAAEETLAIELPDDIALPCKTPAQLAARIVERCARTGGRGGRYA